MTRSAWCWGITPDDCYATIFEKLIRDTAAVGISAAMLGLEIGTKMLRPNFMSRPHQGPADPHGPAAAPHEHSGTVQPLSDPHMEESTHEQIELRAYERWEKAGKPHGWDKEF
jgi:hypothetical protein